MFRITKRVILAEMGDGGDEDPLDAFARLAMKDARDDMTDQASEAIYDMVEVGGATFSIVIEHKPPTLTSEFTVDELSRMLREAKRAERDGASPVSAEDYR